MIVDGKQNIDIDRKSLEKQINNIEIRQQEIQLIISSINNNIQHFESQILIEQQKPANQISWDKIKNLRGLITKNIQSLRELYDCYRGYEDVKFKYYKQITDINVRLRQLELADKKEKIDTRLIEALSNLGNYKTINKIESLEDDLESIYK